MRHLKPPKPLFTATLMALALMAGTASAADKTPATGMGTGKVNMQDLHRTQGQTCDDGGVDENCDVKSPRDAASGQASGKRQHKPVRAGVAAGDVDGDGADVITGAGAGGGPHVKVFDGTTGQEAAKGVHTGVHIKDAQLSVRKSGSPEGAACDEADAACDSADLLLPAVQEGRDAAARTPRVAVGDVNGDGVDATKGVTGVDPTAGPIDLIDGSNAQGRMAINEKGHGGTKGRASSGVAAGDVDGDGMDQVHGAGPGGGPNVGLDAASKDASKASWNLKENVK